jgi:hypothetical protein
MKATWDRKDIEAMYQNHLNFSPEQARELANCYGGATQADINAP